MAKDRTIETESKFVNSPMDLPGCELFQFTSVTGKKVLAIKISEDKIMFVHAGKAGVYVTTSSKGMEEYRSVRTTSKSI